MSSINTNQSALVAIDTLRGINNRLSTLNDQISTGKRVNNAKDSASIWAIATTLNSDVKAFKTVTDSLGLANATLGVARNAAESITNLLTDAKALIASGQESNVDRGKIQTDLNNIGEQIKAISSAASFNGLNLLTSNADSNFLSSFSRDASGTVTSDKITVSGQNLQIATGDFGNANFTAAKGTFTSNTGTTVVLNGTTFSGTAAAALAADKDEVISFAAQVVDTGDSFRLTLDVSGTSKTFEYVAGEGDTSNDVVRGLATLLSTEAGIEVTTQTSSNPTNNNVSLTIKNSGTAAFNAATVFDQQAQGTSAGSTGGLAAFAGLDVETSDATAAAALTGIDSLIDFAIDAAASFGSGQKRVDTQTDFVSSLIDSLNIGISALTDADLTAASAELSSLQVQQQLGLQSLSIANQAPQSILALFR